MRKVIARNKYRCRICGETISNGTSCMQEWNEILKFSCFYHQSCLNKNKDNSWNENMKIENEKESR